MVQDMSKIRARLQRYREENWGPWNGGMEKNQPNYYCRTTRRRSHYDTHKAWCPPDGKGRLRTEHWVVQESGSHEIPFRPDLFKRPASWFVFGRWCTEGSIPRGEAWAVPFNVTVWIRIRGGHVRRCRPWRYFPPWFNIVKQHQQQFSYHVEVLKNSSKNFVSQLSVNHSYIYPSAIFLSHVSCLVVQR